MILSPFKKKSRIATVVTRPIICIALHSGCCAITSYTVLQGFQWQSFGLLYYCCSAHCAHGSFALALVM